MIKDKEQLSALINEHWIFEEGFIKAVMGEDNISPKMLRIMKFLMVENMKHGYKHGVEDSKVV